MSNTDGIKPERERWEQENPKPLEYLEGVARPINIRRLIDQYRAAVNEFADWLLNRE